MRHVHKTSKATQESGKHAAQKLDWIKSRQRDEERAASITRTSSAAKRQGSPDSCSNESVSPEPLHKRLKQDLSVQKDSEVEDAERSEKYQTEAYQYTSQEYRSLPNTVAVEDQGDVSPRSSEAAQISFGSLQRTSDGDTLPLTMRDDGSGVDILTVGSYKKCDVIVGGSGVGKHHCGLELQLHEEYDKPVRRQVLVHKWQSVPTQWTKASYSSSPKERSLALGRWPSNWHLEIKSSSGSEVGTHTTDPRVEDRIYGNPGSFTGVFRARRVYDTEIFAVKIVEPALTLIDHFEDTTSGVHYLAMGCGDMTLSTLINLERGEKQSSLRRSADWMVHQIALGIQHINRHNMAHRDVTPDNIMVFRDDTRGRPALKIAGFSCARLGDQPVEKGASLYILIDTLPRSDLLAEI
ncbi:hypothetical protein FRB90_011462 [Tulasnella sp. 427]|nr:hypothetical protein FRB90_011462 [Tulasnella sp. 427]